MEKTKKHTLEYTYFKMPDGLWFGAIPAFAGCMTYAKTVSELEIRLVEAVDAWTHAVDLLSSKEEFTHLFSDTTKVRTKRLQVA